MIGSRRFAVYGGLFLLTFVSYVDRVNLSVTAAPIAATFRLSPIQLGYVFSAFLWTYVLLLIPMGIAADRFGGRTLTAAALAEMRTMVLFFALRHLSMMSPLCRDDPGPTGRPLPPSGAAPAGAIVTRRLVGRQGAYQRHRWDGVGEHGRAHPGQGA